MSSRLSGREALQEIDHSIARLRRRLADAVKEAEALQRREAEVRDEQIMVYRELADIRLQYLDEAEADDLDRLHQRAQELLDAHDARVSDQEITLREAQDRLERLEQKRVTANTKLAEAVEVYEALVAEVEQKLSKDKTYQELVTALDEAEAILHRAGEKLAVARDERNEKGAPYEEDPLFMYLWGRGFRTTEYEGGGLFKMLDGWVAKLFNYDEARANFKRLNDIPAWLEQHLAEQGDEVEAAKVALEATEQAALDAADTQEAREIISRIRSELTELDSAIANAEDAHQAHVRLLQALVSGQEGPVQEARAVLVEGMKRFAFDDLREMAAETITRRDDELVDRLVRLRTEELDLEVSAERRKTKPVQLQGDLSEFEYLRRGFKAARLDSDYAQFKLNAVNEALADLSRGLSPVDAVLKRLQRGVVRREPRSNSGFGGQRRQQTLGLPDVLGGIGREILLEVEREMSRSGGLSGAGRRRGRSTSFPSSSPRRSSKPSLPARRKTRGGFKTGGGF